MPLRRRSDPPGEAGKPVWGAVLLDLPAQLAEELSGRLAGETLGAQMLPLDGQRCRLTLYIDGSDSTELVDRVRLELRRLGVDPAACSLEQRGIPDGRWVERYQASLIPFFLGRRFVVDPRGGRPETEGARRGLTLVPGRAFGTGEHSTTRLCVGLLEDLVRPGDRWLDLGCGTGILAMVAAHCGAREVLAVDIDQEAVEIARETVRRNGFEGTIRVEAGSLAESGVLWDGVVANVHAALLCCQTREIGDRLRNGGRLIGSGFLHREYDHVVQALEKAELVPERRETDEDWGAVVAHRRGTVAEGDRV